MERFSRLYTWNYNGETVHCYGWYEGEAGFENKHDLIPGGISDFLEDGLQIQEHPHKRVICAVLSLAPPFLMAFLIGPGGFTKALDYSGFIVNFLFGILPIIMAWNARYKENLSSPYQLPGGKPALVSLFIVCLWFMYNVLANTMQWLPTPGN